MQSFENWLHQLNDAFELAYHDLIDLLPNIGTILVIILAAAIISYLLKVLTKRILVKTSLFLSHLSHTQTKRSGLANWTIQAISLSVYWLTFIFFLILALHSFGIETLDILAMKLIVFFPQIFFTALLLFTGWFLSHYFQGVLLEYLTRQNIRQKLILTGVVKWTILAIFFNIALAQLGFDTSLLTSLIVVTYSMMIVAFVFAFILGSREFFKNVISSHILQKQYELGQKIKINGAEGILTKFSPTGFVLMSNQEEIFVPAHHFLEFVSTLTSAKDIE